MPLTGGRSVRMPPEQPRAVTGMFASLADPADPGEPTGEAAARTAYARATVPVGVSPVPADRPDGGQFGFLSPSTRG